MSAKYLNKLLLVTIFTFIFVTISVCILLPSQSNCEVKYRVKLPNGISIKAETAIDKSKGLQGREELCNKCGMIFIFDNEGIYNFWMKDTLINLAMIWIDSKGKVTHVVSNAEPCKYNSNPYTECKVYTTDKPSKYVLEINPEDAFDLKTGMHVSISPQDY